jgi:alcohol dehydrogenase class IV
VAELVSQAGLNIRLREFEVPRDSLETLAVEAVKQWTAGFNPRQVGVEQFVSLYEAAY